MTNPYFESIFCGCGRQFQETKLVEEPIVLEDGSEGSQEVEQFDPDRTRGDYLAHQADCTFVPQETP